MPERMEQADRERLKLLRAYIACHWDGMEYEDGYEREDVEAGRKMAADAVGHRSVFQGNMAERRDWARQEIGRLEAMEHAEAAVVPDGGWHTIGSINSAGIITKPGDIVSVDLLAQTWEVRPSAYEPSEPSEQRLDDFMRERDDAADRRRALDRAHACRISDRAEQGLAGEEDSEQSNRPASRELVERMVREATSHSLWPVEVKVYDDCVEAWARVPKNDLRLIASASLPIKTMEHMTFCRSHITGWTDKMNCRACPACNGSAKVRGYFFGEKQCPDCEGTGVR